MTQSSFAQEADAARTPEAMVYKTTTEGLEISADVYRADTMSGPRPVVVWYHGGALMFGTRTGVPPQILDLCQKENFVVVSMDYRLAPGARIEEIVADVKDGLTWVRTVGAKKFGVNPKRMVVAGASAGGYLTQMSGIVLDPPPTALVSYWGFGDLDGDWCNKPNENYGAHLADTPEEEVWGAIGDDVLTFTTKANGPAQSTLFLFLKRNGQWGNMMTGFGPDTEREKMAPYCPICCLTSTYPPILLLHGTKDADVPYQCATEMAAALETAGVEHELITIQGGGHSLWGGDPEKINAAFQRSVDYMAQHLRSPEKQ